jgi:hypothetical protein
MLTAYHVTNAVGTQKMQVKSKKMKDAIEKCEAIGKAFEYFTVNEWIFESKESMKIYRALSE